MRLDEVGRLDEAPEDRHEEASGGYQIKEAVVRVVLVLKVACKTSNGPLSAPAALFARPQEVCPEESYTSDLSNVVPGVLQARYMCIVYYSVPKNSTALSSDIHAKYFA